MKTVKELLAIARKELGSMESPAGSNRTKYGKWLGKDGYPWCMSFVQWCFDQAGVKLPARTGSCGELMRAAQAAGCWVVRDFRPGDVVIYDFSGKQKTTQHCGIVEMPLPDYGGKEVGVQAIEGNTSMVGSQDNGGMVCRKNRASKYIIGAVRPKFETEKEEEPEMEERYNTMAQLPDYAVETVRKLVKTGAIRGGGAPLDQDGYPTDMDLSRDMIRTLVIHDRMGLYG